jgi:UDP-N-acetylglucosamine--N-acetylmuramyl-(pentapeptide) pyrophosphoryl-undecaprenol N-acetylglucosamine transferase
MKIVLSGGGTLGPVVPLLAVAEAYRAHDPSVQFLWIGTKNGPERPLVEEHNIPFIPVGSGKLRRYFSLLNIIDLFRLVSAFFQCLVILWKEKPDLLISAGGYVSVPLHWAGAFLAMPEWVHQQDVRIGLANKLMFPLARKITTSLSQTAEKMPEKKTEWIGNPSRDLSVADREEAKRRFGIPEDDHVIFALGGGTGSQSVNQIVIASLPHLNPKWHVIHLVGKERSKELAERAASIFQNYHVYDFFTEEMKDAYAAADVVVGRGGFSTLTELASLSKAAIILPMHGTHQEENVEIFAKNGGVVSLDVLADGLKLAQILRDLIDIPEKREEMGKTLHKLLPVTSPAKIVSIIEGLTKN